MRQPIQIIGFLLLLGALFLCGAASGKEASYHTCGVVLQDSGCIIFQSYEEPYLTLGLENPGELQVGDSICISGTLDSSCLSLCPEVDVCIKDITIQPFTPPAGPYSGCGMLIQGSSCILFTPDNQPTLKFTLQSYGDYGVGDLVCVNGILDPLYPPACPESEGHVLANMIVPNSPPPSPYEACGVLTSGLGCLLFTPNQDTSIQLALSYYGVFGAGDTVCVNGGQMMTPQSYCPEADGLVYGNTIRKYCSDGSIISGSGILIQDSGCLLFVLNGDPSAKYVLDNYGSFQAWDTVVVNGVLSTNCQTDCFTADGCILNNLIDTTTMPDLRIPGHLVLGINQGEYADSVLIGSGSVLIDSIAFESTYLVTFEPGTPISDMLQTLLNRPGVDFAEPNFETDLPENQQMSISFPDENPSVFIPGESPRSFYRQSAQGLLGLDSAFKLSRGNGVVVAVIDNGFDLSHPLFADALADSGFDFLDSDSAPADDSGTAYGHGTFVAGLILLTAPECKLIPLRALDRNGTGSTFTIAQAIYYAINHGADIINMSFGMYGNSYVVRKACEAAQQAGIIIVGAGGNDSTFLPMFPAALPGIIAVSALDTSGILARFSNYGNNLDVCAPGVKLYSSLAGQYNWGTWTGTSFSAALVSGICALVRTLREDYTSMEMEAYLRMTAETTLPIGIITPPDIYYGYGRIDGAEALWSLGPVFPGVCGDANGSGTISISDAVFLINFVFSGGAAPNPISKGDANCDLAVNVTDAVYLMNYIFSGGPEPCCK